MTTTTFSGRQALVGVDVDNGVAYTDADQVQSISFSHDQPINTIHQLGSVSPQELKEGMVEVGGTLTRKYETGNFSAMATTLFDAAIETGVKTEYYIGIFPEGDATPKFLISNVKFHNYKSGVAIGDDAMEESVDFKGLAIALSE